MSVLNKEYDTRPKRRRTAQMWRITKPLTDAPVSNQNHNYNQNPTTFISSLMLTAMPQSHDGNVYDKANPELISMLPRSDPLDDHLRLQMEARAQGLHHLEPQLSAPQEDSRLVTLQALLPLPSWASSTARRIADLPITRNSSLRAGKTAPRLSPPATSQITSNYEASLADQRGSLSYRPCTHCSHPSRPGGPFTDCIVLAGFFDGACTNCKVNNTASRCSLYSRTLSYSALSNYLY